MCQGLVQTKKSTVAELLCPLAMCHVASPHSSLTSPHLPTQVQTLPTQVKPLPTQVQTLPNQVKPLPTHVHSRSTLHSCCTPLPTSAIAKPRPRPVWGQLQPKLQALIINDSVDAKQE